MTHIHAIDIRPGHTLRQGKVTEVWREDGDVCVAIAKPGTRRSRNSLPVSRLLRFSSPLTAVAVL